MIIVHYITITIKKKGKGHIDALTQQCPDTGFALYLNQVKMVNSFEIYIFTAYKILKTNRHLLLYLVVPTQEQTGERHRFKLAPSLGGRRTNRGTKRMHDN